MTGISELRDYPRKGNDFNEIRHFLICKCISSFFPFPLCLFVSSRFSSGYSFQFLLSFVLTHPLFVTWAFWLIIKKQPFTRPLLHHHQRFDISMCRWLSNDFSNIEILVAFTSARSAFLYIINKWINKSSLPSFPFLELIFLLAFIIIIIIIIIILWVV